MPLDTSQTSHIPTSGLRFDRTNWPRQSLDESRVAMFVALLQEGETLPPIEVVHTSDGNYLICDGVHRASPQSVRDKLRWKPRSWSRKGTNRHRTAPIGER